MQSKKESESIGGTERTEIVASSTIKSISLIGCYGSNRFKKRKKNTVFD